MDPKFTKLFVQPAMNQGRDTLPKPKRGLKKAIDSFRQLFGQSKTKQRDSMIEQKGQQEETSGVDQRELPSMVERPGREPRPPSTITIRPPEYLAKKGNGRPKSTPVFKTSKGSFTLEPSKAAGKQKVPSARTRDSKFSSISSLQRSRSNSARSRRSSQAPSPISRSPIVIVDIDSREVEYLTRLTRRLGRALDQQEYLSEHLRKNMEHCFQRMVLHLKKTYIHVRGKAEELRHMVGMVWRCAGLVDRFFEEKRVILASSRKAYLALSQHLSTCTASLPLPPSPGPSNATTSTPMLLEPFHTFSWHFHNDFPLQRTIDLDILGSIYPAMKDKAFIGTQPHRIMMRRWAGFVHSRVHLLLECYGRSEGLYTDITLEAKRLEKQGAGDKSS